jgi:colicin import membrane protein
MTKIGLGLVCAVALSITACAGHARSGKQSSSGSGAATSGAQATSESAPATPVTGQSAQGSTAAQTGQGTNAAQAGQGTNAAQTTQGSTAGQTEQGSTSAPASASKALEGRVEQLDRAGNLMLAGTESAGHAFDRLKVDSRTEIMVNGEKASVAQLNEGDEVRASFSGQGDKLHVDRLEVLTQGQ